MILGRLSRRLAEGAVFPALLSFAAATAPAPAQSVVFAENFEGGGLGVYAETDAAGAPAATLWHGEGFCSGFSGAYSFVPTPPPASFPSIAGSPAAVTILGPLLDDAVATIALPIPFALHGIPLATLNVDTNGPVSAGAFSDLSNDPIPSASSPNHWVCAWWDDHVVRPAGAVRMAVVGGSVVLEWNTLEHFPLNGSGENATFQVRLDPSPANTIALLYDGAAFSLGEPWTATIGVEDPAGASGLDPTGLGAANAAFPATNFLLVPGGGTPGAPLPASMGANAAAYNQGNLGIYDYDTGAANAGAIESPPISTPAGASITLSFDASRAAQSGAAFDQSFVEVRPSGGAWTPQTQVTALVPCGTPTVVTVPVAGVGGAPWQHRFRFDTVNASANAYLGWYVDNVSVSAVGAFPGLAPTYSIGATSTTTTIGVDGGPANGAAGLFASTGAGPALPILPSSPEPVWLNPASAFFLLVIPLDASGDGAVTFSVPTAGAQYEVYFQSVLFPTIELTSAFGAALTDLGAGQTAVLTYQIKTGVARADVVASPGLDLELERVSPGGAITPLGTATVGASGTAVLHTTLVPKLGSGETLQLIAAGAIVSTLSLQ